MIAGQSQKFSAGDSVQFQSLGNNRDVVFRGTIVRRI
jgi:hypothetical protein